MFQAVELAAAVDIQKRSYRLLRWVGDAIARGFIRFDRAHQYSTDADAAQAWISEHFDNLPADCRPLERTGEGLERFAAFFASYLLTSFELREKPGLRWVAPHQCSCPMCNYLAAAPHLKAKKLNRRDRMRAEDLKRSYLETLAREHSLSVEPEVLVTILEDPAVCRDAALATYGVELLRRCRGQAPGPSVLALWRQFAWKRSGSPIRDFELDAIAILDAERRLRAALAEAAAAPPVG